MKRINIDGVWYVQEGTTKLPKIDVSEYMGMVYEDDKFCYDANVLSQSDKLDGISINFTDKTVKPWKEEYWDNDAWILGVHNNNEDSLNELSTSFTDEDIRNLQSFIKILINKCWLKENK